MIIYSLIRCVGYIAIIAAMIFLWWLGRENIVPAENADNDSHTTALFLVTFAICAMWYMIIDIDTIKAWFGDKKAKARIRQVRMSKQSDF